MATVERGADGIAVCPQVKTYSRRQVKKLLRPYRELDFKVAGLTRDVLPRIGRLTPRRLLRMLEPRLGWYVVAFAKK
jgi:hypothetical protein